ncbi:MAG: glycosyltransferase family 4 protein [Woeseiaceae bacterium]|nr:glycosyltransferase family 4 protein [Woeseiaceae bacterium]
MTIKSLAVTEGADRPTAETFIGMHRRGVDITVVCPPSSLQWQRLVDAGIRVIDIPLKRNFDKRGQRQLREELVNGDYDILHTFNSRAVTNGIAASKDLPIRIICYRGIVGNVSFLDPMSWKRYLNPRIDRIVCVCDAIRRYFLNMKPKFLRMPDNRPVTIYKGHSLAWYRDEPADLAQFGIPEGAFVVACTATYRPRKGVEYLIAAMGLLPDDVPAHLLLVGNMAAKKISRRIQTSPAADRIHRAGFRDDAPAVGAACDAFCLPSTKREGLPRSVIEAMAYGVPPIVTDSGGSPELVERDVSGIVVPVRDPAAIAQAIEWLYRNPDKRRKMGEAARRRIDTDFRNEDTVTRTVALYEELVPGK